GGSNKTQASFFTRKAELEHLIVQAAELAETITKAETTVKTEQSSVHETGLRLNNLRSEGEKYREMESERAMALREVEAILNTTKDRFRLFEAEQSTKTVDLSVIAERKETASVRL